MTRQKKKKPNVLHDLLVKRYIDGDESFHTRNKLWDAVSGFVSILERNQFDTSTVQAQHLDRVVAFYDYVERYCLPRGKDMAWAISSFRSRFSIVCATLRLRQLGMTLRGAESGWNDNYVKNFAIPFYAALRKCPDKTMQCIMSHWRNKGSRAQQTVLRDIETLNSFLNPVYVSTSDTERGVSSLY